MTGYIHYTEEEAVRNRWFIDELIAAASIHNMYVELLTGNENPPTGAAFVLYRGRDFERSKQWEQSGLTVVNRGEVNRIANDKLQTFQLAALLGIPAIPTKALKSLGDVHSYPVVVKTADGHGGKEVHLCHYADEVEEVMDRYTLRPLIVQPYVEHGSEDVRLYMIGDEVAGAVKRTASDSFKANVALGGTAERFEPPSALRNFAVKLATALKSDYIGVDFIQNAEGVWLLNEIEDPVGARSLYETSELDVAQEVMRHIQKKMEQSL